jgi:hypothetical protein
MLIAWVINEFFGSFTSFAPWADEDVTGGEAIEYFLNEIIGMKTLFETAGNETVPIDNLRPSRIVRANVGYIIHDLGHNIFMCGIWCQMDGASRLCFDGTTRRLTLCLLRESTHT